MTQRLILTALLLFGMTVLISLIPYDFEVGFRKDWRSYRVKVSFRLLKGWFGLGWGPHAYEWNFDPEGDEKGLLDKLIVNLKLLKKLPFSLDQKLELVDTVGKIMENTRLRELHWYTEIGLKDPAQTAVLTGVLWALKGWFCTSLLSTIGTIPSKSQGKRAVLWGVQPNFVKPGLRIELSCRVSGSIGGVITPMLRFLWNVIVQREKEFIIEFLLQQKKRKHKLVISEG